MEVIFIRHAQSENNARVPHGGSLSAASHPLRQADPDITALGRRQVARLAAYLPGGWDLRLEEEPRALGLDGRRQRRLRAAPLGIERLYCSLMRRALQSAAPLAEALAVPALARDDIHEIGGVYDGREGAPARQPGMTPAQIRGEFPAIELPAALDEDGWWRREMESFAAAADRAAQFARWLFAQAERQPAARIAIITHGGWLDLLLRELTGQPIRAPRGVLFSHYNTGMTRVDILRPDRQGRDRQTRDHHGRIILRYQNRVPHLLAALLSY